MSWYRLCGHDQYNLVLKRVRVPNRRYFDVDDGDEDRNMSPMDKFRQDVFQVINDQLISDLKYRLEAYKEISYNFGFLCKLPSLSNQMIKQAAGNITCSNPNDLEPTIESELIQFSSLIRSSVELQTNEKTKSIELNMYEFLHTQTFPNIEIALRIYLPLMVSNCSGEKSFSKLKRIKNELRNRIGQDRLNSLSVMSIESVVLKHLDIYR
ncbi:hypothetical protein LOD99_11330 [Oopsacas minuta]|uniref:HAT C-terminal dimerisation domain-containing protein n=1 Tax=Oopsacas minuta TaxID=111878 RepID=A0AAV7K4D0_9METZ|nr:hypothetical protein LOD99_11330 [Oopsacas minuta]